MKHIIDTDELEKLIKTETDKGWYSVPMDDLRAFIANLPQVPDTVTLMSIEEALTKIDCTTQ